MGRSNLWHTIGRLRYFKIKEREKRCLKRAIGTSIPYQTNGSFAGPSSIEVPMLVNAIRILQDQLITPSFLYHSLLLPLAIKIRRTHCLPPPPQSVSQPFTSTPPRFPPLCPEQTRLLNHPFLAFAQSLQGLSSDYWNCRLSTWEEPGKLEPQTLPS